MTEEDMERADYLRDEIRDEEAIAFLEARNKLQKQILQAQIEENRSILRILKLHGNARNRLPVLMRINELEQQLEKL